MVVLLTRTEKGLFLGVFVFGVGVLTDYLDGYFARRRNQITKLGILLDPLADKLLTAAAFLSLLERGAIPAWVVLIILGRELAVTALRNVAASRGVLIPSSPLGKWKMVTQVVAIFILLLGERFLQLAPLARPLMWIVVAMTLLSGFDYFRRFWQAAFGAGPRS